MGVSEYVYRFAAADYYVIVAYLLMLVSIGFVLKKLCGGVSDYFVGGNKIPWWLAGAGCFMSSFSAWTFTGAAGFAYQHGILIILLFYFNVIAYLFAGKFIAAKCRQTRRVTSAQVIFDRFGRLGEQFFLWIQVPSMLFGGAIWMMGLATFLSIAFGIPMDVTIIVSGVVILIYSTISGSWAVMTSAFLQSLILMALCVVVAVLTLTQTGGISGLCAKITPDKLVLFKGEQTWVWVLAYFSQIFMIFSSATGSTRFLSVRNGQNARKAAYFAAILFLIGPVVWFIPPIAASHFFPNLGELLPGLKHPQDGAYVMMGLKLLPAGLAGLMIMVIFSATLSSMDAAINQNAGIITLNIYKELFRPNAGEKELFIASRVSNVVCGVGVTAGALFLARQSQFALFDLMLILSSVIGLPLAIPFVLMYWIKDTPRWSAVVSILCGAGYSYLAVRNEWTLGVRVFGILAAGGGSFFLSRLFWKYTGQSAKETIAAFYETMNRPVDTEREAVGSEDVRQLKLVGSMAMIIAAGLFVVVLFPNSLASRGIIAATAASIFVIGWLMNRAGRRSLEKVQQKDS
jgi:Na+/proline symporter